MAKNKIKLGKRYKENLHGFEGVAIAWVTYLHGCNRVLLQNVTDGKLVDYWFDEPQVEGCEKNTTKPGGGPNPPSVN